VELALLLAAQDPACIRNALSIKSGAQIGSQQRMVMRIFSPPLVFRWSCPLSAAEENF
jgi:hypothetical protein